MKRTACWRKFPQAVIFLSEVNENSKIPTIHIIDTSSSCKCKLYLIAANHKNIKSIFFFLFEY